MSAGPGAGVLDLRTYKLVPGEGEAFHRIVRERAVPMLERFGIEVLGYGPSLDENDLYYLMRTFASAAQREDQLATFYGSDEWQRDHRDASLALIENYHVVVIDLEATMGQRLMSASS